MSKQFSKGKIQNIRNKTFNRCAYCGIEITQNNFSIDHAVPKSREKDNSLCNLYVCCKSCNSRKKNYSLERFRFLTMCKMYDIPIFSEDQVKYLKKINIYDKCFPKEIKFYFETI